jgi:hypothetical protein
LSQPFRGALAILWVLSLAPSSSVLLGQAPATVPATANTGPQEAWRLPNDQLDSLVAPIALYPDPLLSQTLVASTYPLEIIQLQQWLGRNKDLKDQALVDAVKKQNWDPSIQGLVAVPDLIVRLSENIQWTTDLGNAFLAQPEDVMAAVQRMRAKAQGSNVLVSNTQQTVATEVVEGEKVIVIQQANPEVIYVPSYDPVVVYGAPVYPYPSYVYPGYVPGTGLAFGAGILLGAAWGGGWGYNCGWHGGDVDINVNNNYVRNYNNVNNINNGSGKWAHQAVHRGGAPYGRGGINGVGGGTRPGGVGGVGRPGGVGGAGGVGRPGGVGGAGGVGRPGGVGGAGGVGKPGGAGGVGKPGGAGGVGKPGGIGGAGGAGKPGGVSGGVSRPSTKPATRPSSSIGGRSVSSGSSAGRSAFSGSSGGGNSARASSSRGSGSRGGGGGGRSGGGGGRSGGGRGR